MKRLLFFAAVILAVLLTWPARSQNIVSPESGKRCGTSERIETLFRLNPSLRNIENVRLPATPNNYRLESITTIPVVIHIVLPNPYLVTDADVQGQIDRLNLDYSGLNPDTSNAGAFIGLRGHCQIQFCLAKKTPGGLLTNGIERIASGAGSNLNLSQDPIKHTSLGGLDVWSPDSYLNIWVGVDNSGQGILGYAQFPGTTPVNEDGVFLNVQSFGSSSCYTISAYNKGRTGTHEVGHYFGLFHIWGDEPNCTGDDFENLSAAGSSVTLPANLANGPGQGNTPSDIGDTPNQGDATSTCPSGVVTDACSGTPNGIMYQDYMDYTFDACYSMFTKKQVERMEWVANNARSGLLSSSGCQPPGSTVSLDVAPFEVVNPGGMEANGCTAVSYAHISACNAGTTIQPKLRIKNNGLTTITSVMAGYNLDNGAPVTNVFAVNITAGYTAVITLGSFLIPTGNHSLKFFTSGPNGSTDQTPANDTLIYNFETSTPQISNFETVSFPPAPWIIINPNGDFTWQRKTPGRSASTGAMWIDNYDVSAVNHIDDFRSQSFTFGSATAVNINFQVAHKNYPNPGNHDTLSVLVSNDCDITWQSVYKKWGATLATAGSSSSAYLSPAQGDWRLEQIPLTGAILSSGKIMVAFRNTSKFGNNIFIDDISITESIPAPVVTSVSPASGIIGTTVNITGLNFNTTPANNIVLFGAVRGTVTAATSTNMTVTSPANSSFQPLTVLNRASALMGSSAAPFITTFDNPLINGITSDFYEFKANLPTAPVPQQLFVADLDADGKPELITVNYGVDSICIYRNISLPGILSSSSFANRFTLPLNSGPVNVTVADLDGDGKPDIIGLDRTTGLVEIYRNNYSTGTLSIASFIPITSSFTCGTSPGDLAIADFDRDGRPDVAVASPTDNSIAVLKNNSTIGSISFLTKQNFTVAAAPGSLAIADVDGDGKIDIVATSGTSSNVSVLRNTSTVNVINAGSFAAAVNYTAGNNSCSVKLADLDADNKPEIILLDSIANVLSVYRNHSTSGTISFAAKFNLTTATKPVSVAVSDLDGDGRPDLLYSNKGNNSFSALHRNSNASIDATAFDAPSTFATANAPGRIVLNDLDGDGIPEVSFTGASSDIIGIWQMRTAYTFKGTGNWSIPANWANNKMPPSVLPAGQEIIINPSSGTSVKDINVALTPGSKLTVMSGKILFIP